MSEQPNNDPQLLYVHPESIEELVGNSFLKKKGLTEKDKETTFNTEECGVEEFKNTHKYLALLFCAGWCPPCKTFLGLLKEFYSEVNIDSKQCEVLYVPLDRSEEEFRESYTTMPWLTISHSDQARIKSLKERYRVTGIPHLVIVKSDDGKLVTPSGRKDIHERGFKTIEDWNKAVELNKERE
jgi:thiol-disulfide isomerase/thioredoxin